MAATLDVLTLGEAKAALNIDAAVTTFDTEVASYVTAVSLRLDDLTGPIVIRTVSNELHDGGGQRIVPRHTPVATVSSLIEYSSTTPTTLTAETNTTKPASAYLLVTKSVHNTALLRRASGSDTCFTAGRQNIVLSYTAGRFADTAAVDAKFKQAAAKMLSLMWKGDQGAGTVTFGAPTELEGIGIVGFAIPRAVTDLLADELHGSLVA